MEESQLIFEINAIIDRYRTYLKSEELNSTFSYPEFLAKDEDEENFYHAHLDEFERFDHSGYSISLLPIKDLRRAFSDLDKGSVIDEEMLLAIADLLSSVESIKESFKDKNDYFYLDNIYYSLITIPYLKDKILSSIDTDFSIKDEASAKLYQIRKELLNLEKALSTSLARYKEIYKSYLSENFISFKGGEETLPIKTSMKGYVKGIVVSSSSTGETSYMIPYEVVELKNKITALRNEESEESARILAELSKYCFKNIDSLKKDYALFKEVDRFYAAYNFGKSYQGSCPDNQNGELVLKSLVHPLLKSDKVIANSLVLKEKKILLISGPNAGGKSVFIKALALAVIMDKLGLMVAAIDGGNIPYIDKVYFLGGDNQSVIDNLSTFSAHIVKIKEITDSCTPLSLVIIDEVGEGTSPKDGEALGISLLKYFERVGCYTLLTSHFDGMKEYALADEKVLSAAMEFDIKTLKPTFHILYGSYGKSNGLLLAENLGLKEEIIQDAIEYQKNQKGYDIEKMLEDISLKEKELELKEKSLINQKKNLENIIEKRKRAIQALEEERRTIHIKAEKKIERIVANKLEEIDKIWKESPKNLNYSDISKAKGELNKVINKEEVEEKKISLPSLQVGDLVLDEDKRKATVIEIKKDEVTLSFDGLRFKRKIAGLEKAPKTVLDIKKKPYVETVKLNISPSQGLELNIIGLHVDEAMREVVSFLDNARLHKFKTVRIIHGAGTFALKKAVWAYLAKHGEFVKEYRFGQQGEGGLGATVVILK